MRGPLLFTIPWRLISMACTSSFPRMSQLSSRVITNASLVPSRFITNVVVGPEVRVERFSS